MSRNFATAIIAALLLTLAACADPAASGDNSCRLHQTAAVPFDYYLHLPIVTTRINGRIVYMAVDTGASMTVVTPELAAALQLPDNDHYRGSVTALSSQFSTPVKQAASFEFAGETYNNLLLPVVDLPLQQFRSETASPDALPLFGGLIGTNILSQYDIDFDPARQLFTFYRTTGDCRRLAPAWTASYDTLPVTLTKKNHMLVTAELDGEPFAAEFDTGAAMENIDRQAMKNAGLKPRSTGSDFHLDMLKQAGKAVLKGEARKFSRLTIGQDNYAGPTILVIDKLDVDSDMLLGADYMRLHRFWLSYAARKIFVQPSDEGQTAPQPTP